MTNNPHQRALTKWEQAVNRQRERDEWRTEAKRLAGVADALLQQWRDLASRVSKSSLRYDQDGD